MASRAPVRSDVEIHLLRHAHAGDSEAWDGPDEARPLTPKGRVQSERMGTFLRAIGFQPDVVLSSPKVRALQTAEIVAAELGLKVTVDDRLAEGFGPADLSALLAERPVRRPLLVGHDPDFTSLVTLLCGTACVEMKKGALARVDVRLPLQPGGGMLRWLVPPELLRGS